MQDGERRREPIMIEKDNDGAMMLLSNGQAPCGGPHLIRRR